MRNFMLCGLTLLFCSSTLSQSYATSDIRVLLDNGIATVNIIFSTKHRGFVDGILKFDATSGLEWQLEALESRLYVDNENIGQSITFQPIGSLINWRGQKYRGAIQFVAVGEKIRVINRLDLEQYLRGVVPAEMQGNWPLEALKAQAVASRSYALARLNPQGDYDVCGTIQCQVYRGVSVEHNRSDRAIRETNGTVLVHQGEIAVTYYHSDSGGTVASSAEVWGVSEPYLVSKSDVGTYTPHRNWQFRIDPSRVTTALRGLGSDIGSVSSLQILEYSESGRVSQLKISGSEGSVVLKGQVLNKIVRGWGMKSTLFMLLDGLTAQGDGWGHGVGMSQYGAKQLAQSGYTYSEILRFYYPGTRLTNVRSPRTPKE